MHHHLLWRHSSPFKPIIFRWPILYCCGQLLIICYISNVDYNNKHKMQPTAETQPKRNKELTEKELKNLRMNISQLSISPKHTIYYSLITKDSKSGFFSNERMLILNSKEKELFYTKIPEGLIPFLNEEEVKSLKSKVKVSRQNIKNLEVSQFKCTPVPGKISSFLVEFKRAEVDQWICSTGNSKVMHEWVELINKVLVQDEPQIVQQPQPKHQKHQAKPIQQTKTKPIEQSKVNSVEESKQTIINQAKRVDEPRPKAEEVIKSQQNNIKVNQPLKKVPSQRITRPLEPENKAQPQNQVQNPLPLGQPHPLQKSSSQSYGSKMQESQIANIPYSDHVSQLKYLRGQKPGLFKTNNDLSRPNLHPQILNNQDNSTHLNKVSSTKNELYKQNYEVNSRLIGDSNAEEYLPTSRLQDDSNALNIQPNYGVMPRGGSRKDFNRYPQGRQQQYNQPFAKNKNNQNSQSRQSGILLASNAARSRQANQFQRTNQQYQPVFSKKKIQELSKHPSQQKNIVIKSQDSREDIRIARDPSSNKVMSNNFGSKGGSIKSMNNYNSKGSLNRKKWNQIFAETNSKLQIYEEFMVTSFNVVRDIINELPFDKNQKQFLPIQVKSPYYTYYNQGILITLHYFQNGKNVTTGIYSSDTPLLYDQTTYELLKREFYNYNIILNVTANEGFIKVPLCAYFQYKGILALCKAEIPENFNEITPKRFQKQFDIIENQIHVRFMYGSFNSYLHPSNKYIILDNMRELIPQIPLQNTEQQYFRKQFLLGYNQIIEDMQTCNEAHYHITHQVLPELINRLETLQTYIVCSADLKRICHSSGVSLAYMPLLIQQIKAPYVKKIFISQLVASIFTAIFRSEINHLVATFPHDQFDQLSLQIVNRILLDNCHTLIQLTFGYSNAAQSIWKLIVQQCSQRYKVTLSKEDLIPGYLFGSIMQRFGLVCDFRRSAFNKHNVQFFVKSGNIPQDLLVSFKMHTRRYDLSSISPMILDLQNILAEDPNSENFKLIVNALTLKEESIPNYLQNLQPQILSYLCNFVPYSEHEQFQHIGIYNMIVLQPHSYFSVKLSLLAIKWCIKKKLTEEAFKIYEMKEIQNAFWLGEYNPAISEFYDFFSMFYASLGKYQQAIQLAKLSLKNINKVLGTNELPVADKHYQLGNIYFKMGKKDQSLKQYTKTKEILTSHNQVHISQYAVILLKLSLLYLNFGKISECVNSSLEALKIFDQTQQNEVDQINTFQILSRCYEITKKNNELIRLSDLVAQKFNSTENSQIFERMAKIVLYARLKNLSSPESKAFITIISKLQEHLSSVNYTQAFTFLHRKCQQEILMKKIVNFLENIVSLYEESSKKDLFRRYKRLDPNTRTEAEQMLVIFDALGMMVGYGYLLGSLRESD